MITTTNVSTTTEIGTIGMSGADLVNALDVVATSGAAQSAVWADAIKSFDLAPGGRGGTPFQYGAETGIVAPGGALASPPMLMFAGLAIAAVVLFTVMRRR